MDVRLATEADQEAWDHYVFHHPDGLAYHRFAWRLAVEKAYRFRGLYLLAEDAKGICGVLPLIDFRPPLGGRTLLSLPYCDVGGVLADDAEVVGRLIRAAVELAGKLKAKGLQLRCGVSGTDEKGAGNGRTNKVRMVLPLPGSSEELLEGLKAKLRSQVKKPLRDGLTARMGGVDLLEEFYPIFAENMRDLGSPVHSRRWLAEVLAAFGDLARVGLVYTPEGEPAAGGIILLHGQIVSIPWASSLRRYNRLNPNMLLYWTFLAFAADNGFARFDFGRSTPGEGTYRFKEQWGAVSEPLRWENLAADGRKLPPPSAEPGGSGHRRHLEAVWRRLPLPLANTVGPVVRRWVSL